jgi:hypothetical protein
MIDVFKREHFTTDTNGGAVFLFEELKHVYEALKMPQKVCDG